LGWEAIATGGPLSPAGGLGHEELPEQGSSDEGDGAVEQRVPQISSRGIELLPQGGPAIYFVLTVGHEIDLDHDGLLALCIPWSFHQRNRSQRSVRV